MKEGETRWTREELILAITLYCKLPYGALHERNPEIIRLAQLLGRTPGAVGWKLNNFASLDPVHQSRGIKGAQNVSRLDREVWSAFKENWDDLPYEGEVLRAKLEGTTVEAVAGIDTSDIPPQMGKEREAIVKVRVNQRFFRKAVLAAYDNRCCITGLAVPELLVAGHIRPWATHPADRMDPCNGLALNALHDRAFECGLITITPEFEIRVSSKLDKQDEAGFFRQYHGKQLLLPQRFLPNREFLTDHCQGRFQM